MVEYRLSLKTKHSDENYKHVLNLTTQQENKPEDIFTNEIRESIRKNLQMQSSCKINDHHLIKMITTWIQDIKEGYRDSIITLDLPLLVVENISKLHEDGNQELPVMITPDLFNIEPCFGMLPPLVFSENMV